MVATLGRGVTSRLRTKMASCIAAIEIANICAWFSKSFLYKDGIRITNGFEQAPLIRQYFEVFFTQVEPSNWEGYKQQC